MRIIAGKYRGRILKEFLGKDIRPTSDRVKESLFQILSPRLLGANVLDLFCGSGALGIECLSRGAERVHFNDVSAESLALLRKNLTRVSEEYSLSQMDFRDFLKSRREKFDLIFSDPPYREDFLEEMLFLIEKHDLLKENGILVHESEREETVPAGWQIERIKNYGRTYLYFLEKES